MKNSVNYKVMDYMDNGVIIEDMKKFEVLYINKKARKLLKIKDDDKITQVKQLISNEEIYKQLKSHVIEDMKEHKESEGIVYIKCLDGTFLEITFCCNWLEEEKSIICYTFKKAIEVVRELNVSFKELAEKLPSGIFVMDIKHDLAITYANNEHYRILGIEDDPNRATKKYLLKDFIFEEDVQWVLSDIYMNLANNDDVDIEFRIKTHDNVIKWVRLFGRANISESGEKMFYSSLKDLSERRNIYDKLHMERVLFHKITELTEEVLFRLDLQTNIIHFLGKTSSVFGDRTVFENYPDSLMKLHKVHKDDVVAHSDLIYCFKNGIEKPIELRYKIDEEFFEWYRVTYSFIKNNDGTPVSVIGKMTNINTQKLIEERAKTDLLTGFYNKVTTEQEVDKLISYKNEKSLAFFIIDIDNFKDINDNLGHHFGDMVLGGIADDIKSCFRQDDILGRIGGDEFIAVMRDTGDTSAIVEKSENICRLLRKTFSGGTNFNYTISASVGISMYPSDGTTFSELYEKSNIALFEIKETGKDGYKQYYNDLDRKNLLYTSKQHKDKRITSVLINNTIMTTVLNLLYEAKELNAAIFLILEYIGKTFKLDKCYIFETYNNKTTYLDNFTWSKDGKKSNKVTKNIKSSCIHKILELVNDEGVYYTNDVDVIEDNWTVKTLHDEGIKSMFLVDSLEKYNEKSVFLIEDCKSNRVWSGEEVITLLHASRLLFTALNHYNIMKKLSVNQKYDDILHKELFKDAKESDVYDLNNYNKVSNVVCDFYDEDNRSSAVVNILKNAIKILGIDKASSFIYNNIKNEYFKTYECYISGKSFEHYVDAGYDTILCVDTLAYKMHDEMLEFFSLFEEKKYYYTDDYSKVKIILKAVGFESKNEEDIKDLYIFTTKRERSFSYIVFERYDDEKLSESNINTLTALCKILDSEINKLELVQKYEDDILMKDVILTNEKTPIAVIDKDKFNLLYKNDVYSSIFPEHDIDIVFEELKEQENKCEDCFVEIEDEVSQNKWLKKTIPFTLNNGKEVYMIYFKNVVDYVNQINAVDKLTQCLLLRGFEDYYTSYIQKSNYKYALCTLDIDKFKYINEMFDYKTGDIILMKIADVIRKFVDIDENFCRMNEDKFSIFIRFDDEVNLHMRIRELSKKLELMKNTDFADIKITVVGGITLIDKSLSMNTLLDQSTLARKSAKGSHKNIFEYYNPKIDMKIKKEIQLEEQLPYAVANNEFVAYLQPKFDLQTKKICGAEALVRWITPKGMIFPDNFIPLFERNGFILTLDFIIYDAVMKHIRECLDTGLPVYPISVNVSRNHVKDKKFLEKFIALIKKYDISTEHIELEITESVFVEDKHELKNFIGGIKDYNLKVSIDDFGTAYSSLQSLTDIDVDILKIDKGFLDNIDASKVHSEKGTVTKDEILIKNIINLAKELDFHVICEGIESDNQIELLKKVGCEYGQGYVFAKPMPIKDYKEQFLLG